MTAFETIQSWPREQLESALRQREDQLAKALEAEKLARAGFDKAASERDAMRELIKDAIHALIKSYDAVEWPANGTSLQETTAVRLRVALSRINLYLASARPSGLHVPQGKQEGERKRMLQLEARSAELREWHHAFPSLTPLDLKKQVESLRIELAQFHAAMQRERKPDWQKWHMDLATQLTNSATYQETTYPGSDWAQTLFEAARQLRSMATDYTHKANFVPTDLEIKALKEQLTAHTQALKVARDRLGSCVLFLKDYLEGTTHAGVSRMVSDCQDAIDTINNLLK